MLGVYVGSKTRRNETSLNASARGPFDRSKQTRAGSSEVSTRKENTLKEVPSHEACGRSQQPILDAESITNTSSPYPKRRLLAISGSASRRHLCVRLKSKRAQSILG